MIDLRSDTVTKPTEAMRVAMARADVGDDVLDGDPTVRRLERAVAQSFGMDGAVFVPSATMANLLALMSHCGRGEEYIAGQQAHCYRWEGGGGAVVGAIQPQPIPNQANGTLALADIEAAIKPVDSHFAQTKLICIENTWAGRVLPADYQPAVRALADRRDLALHLDGARLFNASVASGVAVDELTAGADSVTLCLSKGLGAPVGALLVGRADVVDRARWTRKMLGGGMRQSGVMAAAGLYALEHNVERLAEDHRRAQALADGLADRLAGRESILAVTDRATNMVFARIDPERSGSLVQTAADEGVRLLAGYSPDLRLVCHLDVDDAGITHAIDVIGRWADDRT